MTDTPFPLSKDELLRAYRTMRTIREFEERLHVDFAKGDIPGFVHLYAGEEACATGIMMHLKADDRIASTHRGHGHCIAKGVDVREMMAEIYGRSTGACRILNPRQFDLRQSICRDSQRCQNHHFGWCRQRSIDHQSDRSRRSRGRRLLNQQQLR